MKRKIFFTLLLATACSTLIAQTSPAGYSATHSDSCWYFSFDYDTPKIPSSEGMLVITHICTPDTCISSSERHIQGRKYSKRFVKRYGHAPDLVREKSHGCTLTMPETAVNDTVWGITYCEYSNRDSTVFLCDTVAICLPQAPAMSCHRAGMRESLSRHLESEHPQVRNISSYVPLGSINLSNLPHIPGIVTYSSNSSMLNPDYLNNARSIEELSSLINEILADSTTRLEAVQIVGYSSPDETGSNSARLGYARAMSLRNHIRAHHNLHDSVFEIANGGRDWNRIYNEIRNMMPKEGDSIVEALKKEPSASRRETMLKRMEKGTLYNRLARSSFPEHRSACCSGIYYSNKPDSAAIALNEIIDELVNNPAPDYAALIRELKQYRDDPRVLNLQGVIEYRRHHRHAAEQAFIEAAAMGDEQAAINLQIVENSKNSE